MERLIKANLLGAGLIRLDEQILIERYNQCLQQLGIEPTALTALEIDAVGWSPQAAEEKNDLYYLSAGVANPFAIVITPDQSGCPIYFPYNSYDHALMQSYYGRYANEIADITITSGIAIDMDQALARYESPRDFLLLKYVIVRSAAGPLTTAAHAQQGLVERLCGDGQAWFDADLRADIIANARMHGDLRFRRLVIPDMKFAEIGSFHTRALGGVFVMHAPKDDEVVLAVEDNAHLASSLKAAPGSYSLSDPKLLTTLIGKRLLEVNLDWYRAIPGALDFKRECLLAEAVCRAYPDLNYAALNMTQRKKVAAGLADEMPEILHELDRLIKKLANGTYVPVMALSAELRRFLLHPAHSLRETEQDVLRRLLCRIQPLDVLQLYATDKNYFVEQYKSWPEAKKAWAVKEIFERTARV